MWKTEKIKQRIMGVRSQPSILGPMPPSDPIPFFFSLTLVNENVNRVWSKTSPTVVSKQAFPRFRFTSSRPRQTPCSTKKWEQRSLMLLRYVFSLPFSKSAIVSQQPLPNSRPYHQHEAIPSPVVTKHRIKAIPTIPSEVHLSCSSPTIPSKTIPSKQVPLQ